LTSAYRPLPCVPVVPSLLVTVLLLTSSLVVVMLVQTLARAVLAGAIGRIMGPPPAVEERRRPMAVPLSLGPVHHLRLTVTDVDRSRAFYTELLGFQIAMDAPPPADDPHYDLTLDLL
jgi:hypothetical protein